MFFRIVHLLISCPLDADIKRQKIEKYHQRDAAEDEEKFAQ